MNDDSRAQCTQASFGRGLATSFIDGALDSDERLQSRIVTNAPERGENLLSVVKRQLDTCNSFDFCVAFITEGGLSCLVQVLSELRERGVHGRLLTSTYLNFNNPTAFRKLLEYENIETRVYQGDMHAKGYIFRRDGISSVIIGSGNLTQTALTCNREWNILFHSYDAGAISHSLVREFEGLWNDSSTIRLSESWIKGYESFRQAHPVRKEMPRDCYFESQAGLRESGISAEGIKPNAMQIRALEALEALHKRNEPRALLVSATGTGKTYLSAFDVERVRPKRVLFLAHRKRILTASMESYRRLLRNRYHCEEYRPGKPISTGNVCVFAMCSTIVRHLDEIDPDSFDYIVVDEAHRTGSASYKRIMSYLTPLFYLGMTATPNRTDGYDVFALFNHVIAYQITLQDALENKMLVPFHYYGIADLTIDYEEADDLALFSRLVSNERVRHITQKIEEYTVDKGNRKGLIFCNRNDEARELSEQFNALGYRTAALSGDNTDEERDDAIRRLEVGELEYIFSVDIFNEGIDIPSVNQIIMLRRTESAIVFVQQLGRGLRKNEGKSYTLVLDFIGNYQKNFFVPVALSGDKTYNKDNLRTIVKEGSLIVPGASTVSFDRVAEARIYRAIDGGNFTEAKFLKNEYMSLRQMVGHIPKLEEFDRNGSIDPLLIFRKFGSYHAFLSKYEDSYHVTFTPEQCGVLKFFSQKLANGKRFEDLYMIRSLIEDGEKTVASLRDGAKRGYGVVSEATIWWSAAHVLDGDFSAIKDVTPLLMHDEHGLRLMKPFVKMLQDKAFKKQVLEVIEFGISRFTQRYSNRYKDTGFVLNEKYTYEEACRLLGWSKNINGQNIGGYKYDEGTNTFPVFINYDKAPDIDDSIRYEDRFVSNRELIAISKQPRDLNSPEIERLRAWPENGMKIYLFMRKNKADEGSKEFYFFGEMEPTGDFKRIVMPKVHKKAVEITYHLETPIRQDLYGFMTANLDESELLEEERGSED